MKASKSSQHIECSRGKVNGGGIRRTRRNGERTECRKRDDQQKLEKKPDAEGRGPIFRGLKQSVFSQQDQIRSSDREKREIAGDAPPQSCARTIPRNSGPDSNARNHSPQK